MAAAHAEQLRGFEVYGLPGSAVAANFQSLSSPLRSFGVTPGPTLYWEPVP